LISSRDQKQSFRQQRSTRANDAQKQARKPPKTIIMTKSKKRQIKLQTLSTHPTMNRKKNTNPTMHTLATIHTRTPPSKFPLGVPHYPMKHNPPMLRYILIDNVFIRVELNLPHRMLINDPRHKLLRKPLANYEFDHSSVSLIHGYYRRSATLVGSSAPSLSFSPPFFLGSSLLISSLLPSFCSLH